MELMVLRCRRGCGCGGAGAADRRQLASEVELGRVLAVSGTCATAPVAAHALQALHEGVPLLAHPRVLQLEAMQVLVELPVGLLQFVALVKSLGAAVLGIAAVLQGAPLLLQTHHLLPGAAVEPLVQFPHRQRGQHVVVDAVLQSGRAVGPGARSGRHVGRGSRGAGGERTAGLEGGSGDHAGSAADAARAAAASSSAAATAAAATPIAGHLRQAGGRHRSRAERPAVGVRVGVHVDGRQLQVVEVVVVRVLGLLQVRMRMRMWVASVAVRMVLGLHQRLPVVVVMGRRRLQGVVPLPIPLFRLLL